MILQALAEHYQRLLNDPGSGVAPPGYSPTKVSHALVLTKEGKLIDVLPFGTSQGKKRVYPVMVVPEQGKRTSGIAANLLSDNAGYVLGVEKNKQGEIIVNQAKFDDFKTKNELFLETLDSVTARAMKNFLNEWKCDGYLNNNVYLNWIEEVTNGSNLVFKIDEQNGYVHEDSDIKNAWVVWQQQGEKGELGQCLITGETMPIARIHPSIKGVVGSQMSGASIVSFNADSFISYGKVQSYNAPVGEKASFAYATALNYLIASERNRVRLADTTMVFWADRAKGEMEESLLSWLFDPIEEDALDNDARRLAPEVVNQAKSALKEMKQGTKPGNIDFSSDTRCYLLGLAPNAARLSVRFWQENSFGELVKRIGQHYLDLQIVGLERYGTAIAPWRILKELAVQRDSKNIPPLLGGQLLQSILSGRIYPQSLYQAALSRCRVGGEHGGVSVIRAAVVKACLLRKYRSQKQLTKGAAITVSLDTKNTMPAYLLGRLFSVLEKAQKDALGGSINATIRDRYFGAASATPGAVFPLLLKLSQHHLNKAQYGSLLDRKIQNILGALDAKPFPAHLNLEEQGVFILGYYHQNQANYEKSEDKKVKEDNGDE